MATELKFNQEDDEKQQQGPQSLSGGSESSSGGQTAPGGQRTSTPSGRPNIKQYLQANQGAGQKLEQGITGKVQNQANQFNTSLGQARQDLQSSSEPLKTNLGEQGSQKIQTAFKDPQALLNQQNQLQDFQKLRSGGFGQDINQLQTAAQQRQQQLGTQAGQLQGTADLAGNEAGRFQLLRQTYGQPQYTRGQQKLDQLFLQAQPGSMSRDLRNMAGQAQSGVTGLGAEAQAQVNALKGLSDARMQEWNKLLTQGATEGLDTDLSSMGLSDVADASNQRLAQANKQLEQVPGLRERLKNNQLTPQDIETLGLQAGQQLFDVNLNDFINQDNRQATLAGAADPTQVARYRALKQLSGDTTGDIFGNEQNIGTFKPFEFNKDALTQAIQNRQNVWESGELFNQARQATINNPWTGSPAANALRQQAATAQNADQLQSMLNNFARDYYNKPGSANGMSFDAYYRDLMQQSGLSSVENYMNDLRKQRARVLNQGQALPQTETGAVNWGSIADQLNSIGYTLPSNKGEQTDNLNYLAPKK